MTRERITPHAACSVVTGFAIGLLCVILVGCGDAGTGPTGPETPAYPLRIDAAVSYLGDVFDRFHQTYDVYSDADAAGNHFTARGLLSGGGGAPAMDEHFSGDAACGLTCIRARVSANVGAFGGWYFLNGVLGPGESSPSPNWGTVPDAGVDLRGATRLTFRARGEAGTEIVRFFALGVGRDERGQPIVAFPGSAPVVGTGSVTLASAWQTYSIDLTGRDLRYVLGGFGWVVDGRENGERELTFFLDDIRYDLPRPAASRLLISYETTTGGGMFDAVFRNVAFTYDNAVALLAFLAVGDTSRARRIADAFVYAQVHDRRYADGRLRNAYQGGELALPPGWNAGGRPGTARLPGRYDASSGRWLEDDYQTATQSGPVAWAMLALLSYYDGTGRTRPDILEAAVRLGEWVVRCCEDTRGAGGYMAGYAGSEEAPLRLTYKSTEHNIDLYAAFSRLQQTTGDAAWRDRSGHALRFVDAMWDSAGGHYWSSAGTDGVTIEKDVIPLDIQAWAGLALRDAGARHRAALAFAESNLRIGQGFDFDQDRDGVWYEGTAQMAAAWAFAGENRKWRSTIDYLRAALSATGGLPAADRDGLTTGFLLGDGSEWRYYRRLHVAATAWLILAGERVNPFWLGR